MNDPMTRVVIALEQLGAGYEPPRGWEARVWREIDTMNPWWRDWRWWLAMPMGALTALALLCRFSPGTTMVAETSMPANVAMASSNELVLDVIRTVGSTVRGSSAQVGDRIHVVATGGADGDRYRAIWVYHNDRELVLACPAGPSCNSYHDRMTAEVTLPTLGPYIVLAVASRSPLPEPQGVFDADRAAAEEAGATTQVQRLDVR
jgi:hypothetical protein